MCTNETMLKKDAIKLANDIYNEVQENSLKIRLELIKNIIKETSYGNFVSTNLLHQYLNNILKELENEYNSLTQKYEQH
jgi:hypothetical protein